MENYELCNPMDKKNVLGVGSFATVKLAKDKRNGRLVALKIIDKKARTSSTDRENLRNEISIHRRLDHPNIIKLFDTFETSSHVYLVLEYAKHGSLFSYLTKRRRLDEREACKYFTQCCLAMEFLHRRNILHRDFKPENILLDEMLDAKLCDFGWCTDKTTEKKFAFCGTYEYMAPEMVERKRYDESVDIWGLGILLYELLHGYSPFKGASNTEVCHNIRRNFVVFGSSIAADAKDLILRILRTAPGDRMRIEEMLRHPFVVRNQRDSKYRSCSPTGGSVERRVPSKKEEIKKPSSRCATSEGRIPPLERNNSLNSGPKQDLAASTIKSIYPPGFKSARPPLGPASNVVVNSILNAGRPPRPDINRIISPRTDEAKFHSTSSREPTDRGRTKPPIDSVKTKAGGFRISQKENDSSLNKLGIGSPVFGPGKGIYRSFGESPASKKRPGLNTSRGEVPTEPSVHRYTPVSYTHLTLPTIYSV
eukprot:TRINITY_DN2960_c0_g3_i2.p1 TRINITY_DN2960_c0_g3~~TRINITY_DN2960_c0_g3_i2.p1  ORF type:complete len:480 (+),score=82.48 TRINITY_DN2960_c0_g3_i2:152-1591(+)